MECYRCPYRCLCQDFLMDMNCEDALNYIEEENGKTRLTKHGGYYCDDCGNIRDEYCRCDKEIEMYDKLATYEDAEEQGRLVILRWIPVTERLPEIYEEVLTYGELGIAVDNYVEDGLFARMTSHVTHWMPLPQPPKEAEK